ncbi:MAG: histone acetyltransferases subunit 3-domain-containing protein [Benniella sp.]|nr:MAG: histone acetyltransferases subunit 3-domain-containing protein [Benniella sp.]
MMRYWAETTTGVRCRPGPRSHQHILPAHTTRFTTSTHLIGSFHRTDPLHRRNFWSQCYSLHRHSPHANLSISPETTTGGTLYTKPQKTHYYGSSFNSECLYHGIIIHLTPIALYTLVHTKAKRSDDYLLTKTGRSMSPQPKPNTNRHSTPKAGQNRTGDKVHSASHQKKKKNADGPTEKSQKPTPKAQEVQEDFSKVKVANQVAIQTFWASMEPYFRPFTESDRTILEEDNDQVTPLLIPPLGRHYLEAWAEEDRALMPYDGYESRRSSVDLVKENAPSRNTVHNQPFELTDENIEQDEVSCGPLTERIICSLIAGEVAEAKELKQDDDQAAGLAASGIQPGPKNYAELEERMKRELRYVGILGNEEIDWDAREDDEISITLRSLQKELREVMKVNKARKQRLLGLVNNHLAYQEYNTILDDLDKQVEQGYLKRFRMTKSKKKKTSTPKALSENALSAMDRRRRFVQGVGPIFPPENYTIPTKSIYQDELETKTTPSTPQSYRQLNGLP